MSTLLDRTNRILVNLEKVSQSENVQHIHRIGEFGYMIPGGRPDDSDVIYNPEPTLIKFHQTKAEVKFIMGPYGSGKSVGCISELILGAMSMPKSANGVRYCRDGIFRNTYGELESTTIKTFLAWFGQLGIPAAGKLKRFTDNLYPCFHVRFNDGLGWIEWEVMFLAFDRPQHIKKLGSLEVTRIYLNELKEFPKCIFDGATGRIGRYPDQQIISGQFYQKEVIGDLNPCDTDNWYYKMAEIEKPFGYHFFRQPSWVIDAPDSEIGYRLNPESENQKGQQEGYWRTLVIGKTKEYIRVYAKGDYGTLAEGKKVYEEYNDDFHSTENIDYVEKEPLYLAWDFGLTPCLLIAQMINGQLRVIKEFITENMGIENLLEERVKPYWAQHRMDRFTIAYSDGDPAGGARSARNIFEPTLIEVISRTFKPTTAALTNDIDMRLESVRHYLNRMVQGKPALLISRSGCPVLRKGFNGHYCLKSVKMLGKGEDMYQKVPEKLHPISEPQDCLQYIAVRLHKSGQNDIKETADLCKSFMNHGRIP